LKVGKLAAVGSSFRRNGSKKWGKFKFTKGDFPMTTQTSSINPTATQNKPPLLRKALLGNATFSGLSGLFLTLDAAPIAAFIGLENPLILTVTGIVLILYAPLLIWLANQKSIPRLLAWIVIDLDILWVIGSAILIFSNLVPLTVAGKWAIAFAADIVTAFAIAQYIGLRRQK
jgi:hypothetical protein